MSGSIEVKRSEKLHVGCIFRYIKEGAYSSSNDEEMKTYAVRS